MKKIISILVALAVLMAMVGTASAYYDNIAVENYVGQNQAGEGAPVVGQQGVHSCACGSNAVNVAGIQQGNVIAQGIDASTTYPMYVIYAAP